MVYCYSIDMLALARLVFYETSYFSHPEADSELKKPPDPSKILIRRNFRKLFISIRTKIMFKKLCQEMTRRLQLLIRNKISFIRRNNVGLPDDRGEALWRGGGPEGPFLTLENRKTKKP